MAVSDLGLKLLLTQQTIDNTKPFSLEGLSTLARVVDVYDGDSIKLILPVFDRFFVFNARLAGIDTPEMKSKDLQERCAAVTARDRLIAELMVSQPLDAASQLPCANKKQIKSLFERFPCIIHVTCKKFDKYGRLLVEIDDVIAQLLNDKIGYSYGGGTKKVFSETHAAATSTGATSTGATS